MGRCDPTYDADLTLRALIDDCVVKGVPGPPVDARGGCAGSGAIDPLPAAGGGALVGSFKGRRRLFGAIVSKATIAGEVTHSWQERVPAASGAWLAVGGTNGVGLLLGPAYEFNNNAAVPIGAIVEVIRGHRNDDWWFYYRPGAAGPSCAPINITLTGCGAAGRTVTVKLGAVTIGTCTTDSTGKCSVPITTAGTYTITGPCVTTAFNTIAATCPGPNNKTLATTISSAFVNLTGPCSGSFAGTLTFLGPNGESFLTAAGPSTSIPVCLPSPGTWLWVLSGSACYQDASGSLSVGACGGGSGSGTLTPRQYTYTFTVTGCNGLPLQGALVSITGHATAACTTDAAGQCTITLDAGCDYTLTASKARFTAASRAFSTGCSDSALLPIALTATSSFVCCGACADPLPKTLFLADANGTHTLTFTTSGVGAWFGCYLFTRDKVYGNTPTPPFDCLPGGKTGGTIVIYQLVCSGSFPGPANFTLHQGWWYRDCGVPLVPSGTDHNYLFYELGPTGCTTFSNLAAPGPAGSIPVDITDVGDVGACAPFDATFSFPATTTFGPDPDAAPVPVPGVAVITE